MTVRRAARGLLALMLLHSIPAAAATKLEGEYQLMVDMSKPFRAYPWDYDSNDGSVDAPTRLWLFSQPRPGIESFMKVEAQWDRGSNSTARPEFQYREAHLRFRREMGTRGIDSYLFSRQNRFWVDNYLIRFVGDRGDAQGVRVESWGFLGANATFIVGDQSSQLDPPTLISGWTGSTGLPRGFAPVDSLVGQAKQRTDDLYVGRLRREFLKDHALRLGTTWTRSENWTGRDSISGRSPWNSVLGFDSRYRFRGADFSLEFGVSGQQIDDPPGRELTFFRRSTGIALPKRGVIRAEIRSLKLGTEGMGFLSVTPQWWAYGPAWQNNLGGPSRNESGFLVQSNYLLPDRAVTYSNQFTDYTRYDDSKRFREVYNELYVEFINGFTGKTAYKQHDEFTYVARRSRTLVFRERYLSWMNELQVESRLAWLRVQTKSLNIGRPEGKQLFVIEDRINLTEKTKIYNRFALGSDPAQLRKGVFTQLQYRPTDRMEMYLSYGPDYIGGGSNPVEDGNLSGSGNQVDEIKFILKGSF